MTDAPTVDVHTHWMPLDMSAPSGVDPARWPTLVECADGIGEIRVGDEVFRRVARECWDAAARIAAMDKRGIDVEVLLPVPVTIDYTADPATALAFAQLQNDRIAATVAQSGGRFVGFGSVPLQDPSMAVAELRRVTGELGLRGVEIGASVRRRELSDPELRPFFRTADEIGARIFVHPLDGGGAFDRCLGAREAFGIGMLTDTALAATALTFGGVLSELQDLVVCLAHGGGSFAWCYPRLLVREMYGRDPADAAERRKALNALVQRLYVDSLVFQPSHLPVLDGCFGPGHVLFGSDLPFVPASDYDVLEQAGRDRVWSAQRIHQARTLDASPFVGTTGVVGAYIQHA
jgi:Predicted metal-dependent hydrolase of the TIM-barrel fold